MGRLRRGDMAKSCLVFSRPAYLLEFGDEGCSEEMSSAAHGQESQRRDGNACLGSRRFVCVSRRTTYNNLLTVESEPLQLQGRKEGTESHRTNRRLLEGQRLRHDVTDAADHPRSDDLVSSTFAGTMQSGGGSGEG